MIPAKKAPCSVAVPPLLPTILPLTALQVDLMWTQLCPRWGCVKMQDKSLRIRFHGGSRILSHLTLWTDAVKGVHGDHTLSTQI